MNKYQIKRLVYDINTRDVDELRIKLYAIYSEIVLSKELFKNNVDIELFLKEIDIEFKEYVYKSRTIIISRVIRIIEKSDKTDLNRYYEYIKNLMFDIPKVKSKSKSKKSIEQILEHFNGEQ